MFLFIFVPCTSKIVRFLLPQVTLPVQLKWFRSDFTELDGSAGDLELMRFAQNQLLGDKAVAVQRLLMQAESSATASRRSSDVAKDMVSFGAFDFQLGYRLVTGVEVSAICDEPDQRGELHLPSPSIVAVSKAPYNLTESTMEYLANKLPLASALANLVCPPRLLEKKNSVASDTGDRAEFTSSIRATMSNFTERFGSMTSSPQFPEQEGRKSGAPFDSVLDFVQESLEWTSDFPPLQRFIAARLAAVPYHGMLGHDETTEFIAVLQALLLLPSCSGSVVTVSRHLCDWFLHQGWWKEAISLLDSEMCMQYGGKNTAVSDVWLMAAASLSQGESTDDSCHSLLLAKQCVWMYMLFVKAILVCLD